MERNRDKRRHRVCLSALAQSLRLPRLPSLHVHEQQLRHRRQRGHQRDLVRCAHEGGSAAEAWYGGQQRKGLGAGKRARGGAR